MPTPQVKLQRCATLLIFGAALGCDPAPASTPQPQPQRDQGQDMREPLDMPEDGLDAAPDADMSTAQTPLIASATAPAYALVGEPVSLDASQSQGATGYQWDFGDGRRQDAPSPAPITTITYDAAGRYRAVLTAYGPDDQRRTTAVTISVVKPRTHTPNQSSSVYYHKPSSAGAAQVGVVNDDAGMLSIYEQDQATSAWEVVTQRQLCAAPRSVAAKGQWWFVSCHGDDRVIAHHPPTDTTKAFTLPYGARPFGLISTEEAIFVALMGKGQLAKLRFEANDQDPGSSHWTQSGIFDALPDARGVAQLPNQRIAVSRWRSDQEGQLAILDEDGAPQAMWRLPYDDRSPSDTEHGGVPNYLDTIAVSPQGDQVIIPSLQANVRHGLYLNQQPLAHDLATRAVLSFIDPQSGQDSPARRYQYDSRGLATAAVHSPQGDYLYVAMRGMRTVERFDLLRRGDSGTIFEVGHAPQGLAISHDGALLFVDASLDRQLVIYDITDWQLGPTEIARKPSSIDEPLAPQILRGKQLFNDSYDTRLTQEGYIACAHCHLDGQADGQTWDFTDRGEGLRNTTSLLGRAGMGHGPVHWSANFDEIQDFEHDIRLHFKGSGLLNDTAWANASPLGTQKAGLSEDLDALAAYVGSLTTYPRSPYRQPDGTMSAQALAGKAIFEDPTRGCVSCHSGANLTDSAQPSLDAPLLHDVGTLTAGSGQRIGQPLTGIDTPTLFELYNSAPYLHHGGAADLITALLADGQDKHGKLSDLDQAQLRALEAYLLSLDGAP